MECTAAQELEATFALRVFGVILHDAQVALTIARDKEELLAVWKEVRRKDISVGLVRADELQFIRLLAVTHQPET